jgi:hypothetical protein
VGRLQAAAEAAGAMTRTEARDRTERDLKRLSDLGDQKPTSFESQNEGERNRILRRAGLSPGIVVNVDARKRWAAA